ncbi:MAG: FG-GAP repeat domain-containing protein, partial [Planctomycetota bacterium]
MRIKRLFPMVFLAAALSIPTAGCPKKKRFHPAPDNRGFGEFILHENPGAGWNTFAVVLGDVDGDGDL